MLINKVNIFTSWLSFKLTLKIINNEDIRHLMK